MGGDEAFPSMFATLTYLKNWGFKPKHVLDIGAYHGRWSCLMKSIFPSAKIMMIEAQSSKKLILEGVCKKYSPDISFHITLLGSKEGEMVDFVEMESGSSVFEEQSPYFPKKVLKKSISTVDKLIPAMSDWEKIDFIKIDVQGYELEVLKGASKYLPGCDFILMEVSLIPVNKGCPMVTEIIEFMSSKKFRLFDICELHRRKDNSLWQADFLFINEASKFLPKSKLDPTNWSSPNWPDDVYENADLLTSRSVT